MPLTAAEKMKRYRERLKNNPEKYEEQRKKNLERIKSKYKNKKISEMTDEEKAVKRRKWREEKQKQKEQKKIKKQVEGRKESAQEINENRNRKSRNKYKQKLDNALSRIIYLQRLLETKRKQLYRAVKKQAEERKEFEIKVEKLSARNEVLEFSLKLAYKSCKTNKEKDIIKTIAQNEIVTRHKAKVFIAKKIGLNVRVRDKKSKPRNLLNVASITQFFNRDDVSRATAGKREFKTLKKNRQQIRYLNNTLKVLHEKYKSEGGSASFTTFCRYKPFYVLSPTLNNRNTCLCVKHDNMCFKLAALKRFKVINISNTHELLKTSASTVINYYLK